MRGLVHTGAVGKEPGRSDMLDTSSTEAGSGTIHEISCSNDLVAQRQWTIQRNVLV